MKNPNRQVMIHKRWKTIHELHDGRTCCGNGLRNDYERMIKMRFSAAHPIGRACESLGCTKAREA
jgi:hypothetical protein